jgi:S1-C subfamily serine protease
VAAASPPDTSIPDAIDRSLPGVVLLLNSRSNGKTGFGAGIILDNQGLVLTNLHVVANARSLGTLFYKPDRVSYMPSDGAAGQ